MLFSSITNGEMLKFKTLSLHEAQLVRCLTYISHRYFAPNRTVVISSRGEYRDVQQELIAEIQRSFIWPAVVSVDGYISIPEETHFIDRDGSYIILVADGDITKLAAENLWRSLDRKEKFTRLWNSEARFVVAEQMNYQFRNKEIYWIISQNLEYITALL